MGVYHGRPYRLHRGGRAKSVSSEEEHRRKPTKQICKRCNFSEFCISLCCLEGLIAAAFGVGLEFS
jgi:hypothetical protein